MPSPNPRIQVCASPDLYARVKTLAKGRGITLSNMVQELCKVAFTSPAIRSEYQQACETTGEVPVKEDLRQRPQARPWSVDYTEEDRKKADLDRALRDPALLTGELHHLGDRKESNKDGHEVDPVVEQETVAVSLIERHRGRADSCNEQARRARKQPAKTPQLKSSPRPTFASIRVHLRTGKTKRNVPTSSTRVSKRAQGASGHRRL